MAYTPSVANPTTVTTDSVLTGDASRSVYTEGEKHIRISHVYDVDHPASMTQLMTPADFTKPAIAVCDNWLDVLPADLTSYIIKLSSAPSPEALADLVYKETVRLTQERLTTHGDVTTYGWTFEQEESDLDRLVKDDVLHFDDMEDDAIQFIYKYSADAVNNIIASWTSDYFDSVFDYYLSRPERYIKNNKYSIGSWFFVEDEDDHTYCVKTRAMSYFLITCFHENYKLMVDQSEIIPDEGGDEGDYFLRVRFFKRGEGETVYDRTEAARRLEELIVAGQV